MRHPVHVLVLGSLWTTLAWGGNAKLNPVPGTYSPTAGLTVVTSSVPGPNVAGPGWGQGTDIHPAFGANIVVVGAGTRLRWDLSSQTAITLTSVDAVTNGSVGASWNGSVHE